MEEKTLLVSFWDIKKALKEKNVVMVKEIFSGRWRNGHYYKSTYYLVDLNTGEYFPAPFSLDLIARQLFGKNAVLTNEKWRLEKGEEVERVA